jgi:tetratricopeptide (TPR) repeat protein
LTWAEYATNAQNLIGQENFSTLSNLALLQDANGKIAEAEANYAKAIALPGAAVMEIHQLGRQLLAQKKIAQALKVFEVNAKRFPNEFAPQVGLARAEAASGNTKEAIARLKKALGSAPNEAARTNAQNLITSLEAGKAID